VKLLLQWQVDAFYPYESEDTEQAKQFAENSIHEATFKKKQTPGEIRSIEQNRLQFQWFRDLEKQGDMTAQEYRAYSKLHFGVPLLRSEDEEFRTIYDEIIRPLPYEKKLQLMVEPIDLPVTSRMNVGTMTAYLKQMSDHWLKEGFMLAKLEHLKAWMGEMA
jgi:transposase